MQCLSDNYKSLTIQEFKMEEDLLYQGLIYKPNYMQYESAGGQLACFVLTAQNII